MRANVIAFSGDVIRVESEVGCFQGIWCSQNPVELKLYDFELGADEIITSESIRYASSNMPSICNSKNRIYINGLVENVEDDVLFLRLARSIVMLEIANGLDIKKYIDHYVCITLNGIKLYDTGI